MTEEQKRQRRNSYLRRIYGITLEQYETLLHEQNDGCALCGKSVEDEGKSLAVDHNHATGEIRGLLCGYCNHRVIGRHRDSDLLLRMAAYVNRGTGFFVPDKKPKSKSKRKCK